MATNNSIEVSLDLMRSVFPSSILWLVVEVVNFTLSTLCFFVLYKSPLFGTSATYTIIRWLLVNDAFCSMYFVIYQCWHVKNYLTNTPEVMSVTDCYKIVAIQWLFYFDNLALNLFVSVQRLCCIVKPNTKFWRSFKFGSFLCLASLAIGLMAFLSNAFLDTFPDG